MDWADGERLKEENEKLKDLLKDLCKTVDIVDDGLIYFQRKTIALEQDKIKLLKDVLK